MAAKQAQMLALLTLGWLDAETCSESGYNETRAIEKEAYTDWALHNLVDPGIRSEEPP